MRDLITLANDDHMDNYVTLRKCWGLFTMTRLLTVDLKNTISGGMSLYSIPCYSHLWIHIPSKLEFFK